ncbi:MAG: hypothetical protein M1829_003646 [Trizodia sp. TS-e1964]|nr:MAG: hypothetical protein M1829_003646 [Trizodia sp. TS-e1964]
MSASLPFRDINVHASASHYAFTSPSSPSAPTLVVQRPSGDLRLNDGALLGAKRVSSIAGILGIIKLRLDKYIIVITKAHPIGRLKGHMIYKVVATELLPMRESPLHDADEDTYLALLKQILRTGPMYFSYSFDITNSFQRQAKADLSEPVWKRADDRFFWNRFIQTDLIDLRTGGEVSGGPRQLIGQRPGVDPYILPVIFGMVNLKPAIINGTPLTFSLISRRSRFRAGTRFFSRGLNEQGHVSNYNETEQIVILNDNSSERDAFSAGHSNQKEGCLGNRETQVLSYVQTRGSIPAYWAEINDLRWTPKIEIRSIDHSLEAARQHFDEQIRIYGDNYLVNLVKHSGREGRVKNAYEDTIRSLISKPSETRQSDSLTSEKVRVIEAEQRKQHYDRLHYVYFDWHNETKKGQQMHKSQILLDRLTEAFLKQQYFRGVEMPGNASGGLEVRNLQSSVIRTNCMDCLDRTNVVQSLAARWILDRMLIDQGILPQGSSTIDDAKFEFLFRNVWADNADAVSKAYSGTGALQTDFTRTGRRTKAGMFQDLSNSLTRYVLNNFADGPRQDAYDLFLGSYLPSNSSTGSAMLFVDRRPVLIQSIPYILAASFFMVFVGTFTKRLPQSANLTMRIFILVWIGVGAWCLNFMFSHSMLYINWPRLNQLPWASEGVNDAISLVRKDRILGPLAGRHDRSASTARISHLEEGKKRIE